MPDPRYALEPARDCIERNPGENRMLVELKAAATHK